MKINFLQIDFSKNKIWCKSRIVWLETKLTDWGLVVHLWGRLEVGRVEELVCRVLLSLACHGAVILLVRLHGGAYVSPGNLPRMKDTIKLQKNNFLCFKFFSCFGFSLKVSLVKNWKFEKLKNISFTPTEIVWTNLTNLTIHEFKIFIPVSCRYFG